jgi:DNA-directed RNA polymerase specialized sigma24 family protein
MRPMNRAEETDDGEGRDLVRAARSGDELALGCLLAPYWCGLNVFCGLMLGDAEAADRALAETVRTARSEVEVIESRASVRIWIHRIAARACLRAVGDSEIRNHQPPEPHEQGPCWLIGLNGVDEE